MKKVFENLHLYRFKTVEEMIKEFSKDSDMSVDDWRYRLEHSFVEDMDKFAGHSLTEFIEQITCSHKILEILNRFSISNDMICLIENEHNSLEEIYPNL